MKRKLKIKPIYECRCTDRLQTKKFIFEAGWAASLWGQGEKGKKKIKNHITVLRHVFLLTLPNLLLYTTQYHGFVLRVGVVISSNHMTQPFYGTVSLVREIRKVGTCVRKLPPHKVARVQGQPWLHSAKHKGDTSSVASVSQDDACADGV
jgi:hypothetical protein